MEGGVFLVFFGDDKVLYSQLKNTMASTGIEPTTLALLAPRSNQQS